MDSFLTFINQHNLDLKKDATLLAISGGVDSVVMAHLFYRMGFKAAVAHCNFGLRGQESEEDEQFARRLAAGYGFDFYSKKFNTKSFAHDKSVSTQMAAREMRYEWFEEVRNKMGYQWIASAHHANDSFETVLLNLARGTGLAGLHGIAGINNVLLRPLLYVTKAEILGYASENKLEWREDRSNETDDYRRNILRHHVVPVFQKLNPSLENTFGITSKKLQAAHTLLSEFLEAWKCEVVRFEKEFICIDIKKLMTFNEPEFRLWSILESYHFNYSQVQQIVNGLTGIPGKLFYSFDHILLIDRTELFIKKIASGQSQSEWVINSQVEELQLGGLVIFFRPVEADAVVSSGVLMDTIFVDQEKLVFPLKIRGWRQGDIFHPFGMRGKKKKVSDLFTDLKLNLFQKESVMLLENGDGEIIWVIGIRPDERFKIQDHTRQILEISVVGERGGKKI